MPAAMVPENTRPKAKKRPLSAAGIIFDTYTISGPLASQLRMAEAYASSSGPCQGIEMQNFRTC